VKGENELEAEETLPPGTELGRYQITRLMGRGGMGAVYEGIHRDLKKRVAIKTLHPSVAATPGARARFLREGEAASRIRHPNVVDVTDVGTENGVAYLVMELLEGEDLSALLGRVGALPFAESVDLILPVFAAISVAHDEGVIHRDLKPENIFLARARHGRPDPKVLDFGISKISSTGGNTLALTGTGASMGTPYYIAPEQVRSASGVDARSDQYALGAILYECVTGHRAHRGETIYEVIRSVGEGSFPPPRVHRPDIPRALEDAILRAMGLEPAQRFSSVRAFGRAILPLATPAARAKWAPAFAGDDAAAARAASTLPAASQPGGTVVFATPAPGNDGVSSGGQRGPLTPRANTTFGSSAAQITLPPRNRPGLLAGGFVLLAGAAVAAYFVTAPASRRRPEERSPAAPESASTAPAAAAKAPARYRVAVTAHPRQAHFDLDGSALGTGRIDEELAADGAAHILTVTAPGFVPTRLTFRDHPPAEDVTLEPVPPPTPPPAEASTASAAHSPRPTARPHGHASEHAKPAVTTPRPSGPTRTGNNAPIIDD
jgi:serine/threonine-protein kinase